MAHNYRTEYECCDCEKRHKTEAAAEKCHSDYYEIFVCELCGSDYLRWTEAKECPCESSAAGRAVEVVSKGPGRATATVRAVPDDFNPGSGEVLQLSNLKATVRGPQPGCEFCGMAQRFGRVVYCRCMR